MGEDIFDKYWIPFRISIFIVCKFMHVNESFAAYIYRKGWNMQIYIS